MASIVISNQISATNTDILSNTVLNTIPWRGKMTFQMSSSAATVGTSSMLCGLAYGQNTPFTAVLVPVDTIGKLDSRQWLSFTFGLVDTGAHIVFSLTEEGTAVVTYRVIAQSL